VATTATALLPLQCRTKPDDIAASAP
jgi:hypothetical protein